MESGLRILVVGGGAAGFFAAIASAESAPSSTVTVLEKTSQFLGKVKISGGGRCNVTHACFDVRELTARYPRGERALIGLFHRFQSRDTVEWFERRGVELKAEPDGRMFPTTDSSQTIINCLTKSAISAGVRLWSNRELNSVLPLPAGGFSVVLKGGQNLTCDRLLLATGGCRAASLENLVVSLGHTVEPPVPSLFTFHIETEWLRQLAGVSMEAVEVSVPGCSLSEQGPVLITHWGLSGPAILRLSAWGARVLHARDYRFLLVVNWLSGMSPERVTGAFQNCRISQGARLVVNAPVGPVPIRLWEKLVAAAGVAKDTRWAGLVKSDQHRLMAQLTRTELQVTGKSLNKDEFVTCGGVRLAEVNFKTMESKIRPGLFFAGELLDVDGITGGFNFQAAWTTGWIAGRAMAGTS